MTSELPYAAEAQVTISYDELQVLRLQYEKEGSQDHPSIQTKFNYAWGLVKSPNTADLEKGVKLFRDVYKEDAMRRRECLYYMSLGYYRLGNYEEARKFNALLLDKEPGNLQAQSLGAIIDKAATRDSYVGMAIAGGAAALGTLLIAGLIKSSRSRK